MLSGDARYARPSTALAQPSVTAGRHADFRTAHICLRLAKLTSCVSPFFMVLETKSCKLHPNALIMRKALTSRSATISPIVSVASPSPPPATGQPNGAEQQTEPQRQQTPPPLEAGRTSLNNNLEEIHTDTGDGASSATALGNPVFYAGVMLRGHKGDLVRLFELPPHEVSL